MVGIADAGLPEHGDVSADVISPQALCFRSTKYAITTSAIIPTMMSISVVVNPANVVVVVVVPVPVGLGDGLGCPSTIVLTIEKLSEGQTHRYPLESAATGVLG